MKDFTFQTPVVQIDEVKQNIINGFRALIGTEKISRMVMQLSIADLQCLGQVWCPNTFKYCYHGPKVIHMC